MVLALKMFRLIDQVSKKIPREVSREGCLFFPFTPFWIILDFLICLASTSALASYTDWLAIVNEVTILNSFQCHHPLGPEEQRVLDIMHTVMSRQCK